MARKVIKVGLSRAAFTNPKDPKGQEAGKGRSGWISRNETAVKMSLSPTRQSSMRPKGPRGNMRGRGNRRGGWSGGQQKYLPY